MGAQQDAMVRPSILIVEDCFITATALAELLEERGFNPIGPTGSIEQALSLIDGAQINAALLDVALGKADSFLIAGEMRKRGIRYAFLSGHNPDEVLPPDLQDSMFIAKPYCDAELVSCVKLLTSS